MPEKLLNQKLVSVIIPCYNGEDYIENTIKSVLSQSYSYIQLIIVNDGSTDKTELIISQYLNTANIDFFSKKNEGVSVARNFGLTHATGEYVLFLDADDLLEPDFLKKRVLFLQNHPYYSACCTSVRIIDEKGAYQNLSHIGVHDNFVKKILYYKSTYSTCPSNYLFKKKILTQNSLFFNIDLSSSADRFFLIESSQYIKIGLIYNDHNAKLLYRMHHNNMSRAISPSLLKDNKLFMKKVFDLYYIPNHYKKIFKFKVYYILSGGYFRLKKYSLSFSCAIHAFFCNPIKFIKQLCAA